MIKVILFGAGDLLEKTIQGLKKDVKVIAIADNDKKKWGTEYRKIVIIPPNNIHNYIYDAVIISNERYSNQIKQQLRKMNVHGIVAPYSDRFTQKKITIMKRCMKVSFLAKLYLKEIEKEQDFFPTWMGAITNPYFFSRRSLWKNIIKNKKYIFGRCMDFGCGSKPYAELFDTTQYVGVEIESKQKKEGIVYYNGRNIPFENEYFDSILCSEVLEHVPNVDDIVDELKRVLARGGYILVTVPFAYPEHCMPYDFRRFSSVGIKKLFMEHGFIVVKQLKSGSFVNTISQMKGVYINEKLSNDGIMKYVKGFLVASNNLSGIVKDKILPKDNDLYLDNVIVLRKL